MIFKFWRSEDGNFAVTTGVMVVPLLAGVAGVVDFTSASNEANRLQNSLDASALAIATKYSSGMTHEQLTTLGQDQFSSNMGVSSESAEEIEYKDELSSELSAMADAEGNEDFITVRSGMTYEGILGSLDWPLERRSVVRIKKGAQACVLALDEHADAAIKLQGSTDIGMTGCVIAANSDSATSVSRGGSALLSAACVNTVGGTTGIASSSNVSLDCSAPLERQYPSFDPMATLATPTYTACKSVPGGKTKTLSPGTFCSKTLSGDITLEPGVYVLRGGRINLGGNGSLVGAGVTIFLMDGVEFSVNGNETIQLTPPTEGDYAGIAIYQEKSNTNTLTINGTSDSFVSGFVYAPGAHIFYAGNSITTTQSECLRLVGATIELTGNSDLKSDCSAELGGKAMYAGRYMSIVR